MRVAIFKEFLDPHSGFTKHILEVSRRLSERHGYRFITVTSGLRCKLQPPAGTELVVVGGHPYSYTHTAYHEIKRHLQDFQPDLVDYHGGPGAFMLARPLPYPAVFTMHPAKYSLRDYKYVRLRDLIWERSQLVGPGYLINAFLPLRLLGALLRARGPRALAVPSRALQRALDMQLDIPVFHLPSGVEPESFCLRPSKGALGFSADERIVLFYGKCQLLRGIDTLLEAFAILSRNMEGVRLLLALRPDLASRRISEMVRSHPARERVRLQLDTLADVRVVLAAADVVALPFRSPTALPAQPLTLLEAMAAKKPIVSTDLAPIREIVEDGSQGLLVPPNRPDLLAEALSRILTDEKLAERLGANARGRVVSEYSWDQIAERTHRFYQAALKERT